MDQFTIIIPTRNRPEIAHELVLYIREELGWSMPIIIADQSEDGGDRLRQLLQGAERVEHVPDPGFGPGHARNAGAMRADTPWLIFLDDDVRPCVDHHEVLIDFLKTNPWVDAVRSSIWRHDDWLRYQQHPMAWLQQIRARKAIRAPRATRRAWPTFDAFLRAPAATYETLSVALSSGDFAITKRAFVGAGGFDEQMPGIGEDKELGLRLWWYGYRTCACQNLQAFHLKHATGGVRDQRRRWAYGVDPDWIYFMLK